MGTNSPPTPRPGGRCVFVVYRSNRASQHEGTLLAVRPKGYRVQPDHGEAVDIRATQLVRMCREPMTLAPSEHQEPMPAPPRGQAASTDVPLAPVPKARGRLKSSPFLDWVRRLPCLHCGRPGPSDPHHEGKRGVGQKAHDTLAVPLCRLCHQHYTDRNVLPPHEGQAFDRETSLLILRRYQEALLLPLLAQMPLEHRVAGLAEIIGQALAQGQVALPKLNH